MNTQIKIAFLGGDARQRTAAVKLADEGYSVSFFGGTPDKVKGLKVESSLEDALASVKIAVLPLPSSVDGITLNAPLFEGAQIKLSHIIDVLPSDTLLVGGRIPEASVKYAEEKGLRVIDYFISEVFQIKNAYTTAEAALSIAMNNMKKNIRGARFAVTGYGRIARSLTALLKKMEASVCVLARKESDLAWASLEGAEVKKLDASAVEQLTEGYDIIFNTVPAWLFFEDFLSKMSESTQIIDLASSPGGVDVSAAKKLGSKVLWASSLPGKYAPDSAGALIADCVRNIASEVSV